MRRALLCTCLASLFTAPACDDTKKESAAEPKSPDAKNAEAAAKPEDDAETKAAAKKPEPESYGEEFCATIEPCFVKFEYAGNFVANVSIDIEPDGSVSSASFQGEAPQPVQTCIIDSVKAMKLEDYNGKPGRVTCKKNGQIMAGGGGMIMSDMSYEIRGDAGPGEAKAEPEAEAGAETP